MDSAPDFSILSASLWHYIDELNEKKARWKKFRYDGLIMCKEGQWLYQKRSTLVQVVQLHSVMDEVG